MPLASQPAGVGQKDLGFSGFDLADYMKYRPQYPPSLYTRLYQYHSAARPGNTFQIAHDEGTGPGITTEKLSEKFAHVIASDPNVDYIEIAERRLTTGPRALPKACFTFYAEAAEKSSVADGSVDCVTICEAIHWTDFQKTVSEAARQLKSGGTFCVVHYNVPHIIDNEPAQRALQNLLSTYASGLMANPNLTMYHTSLQALATGYDCVGFDEDVWVAGVERRFTNCRGDRKNIGFPGFFDELEDRSGKYDERMFIEDDAEWQAVGCDLEWIRQSLRTFLPLANYEQWSWDALSDAMEESGGKVTVRWPNVQIFATRI
jgi:SAM-dependent methyltransferase